jgi:transketolase
LNHHICDDSRPDPLRRGAEEESLEALALHVREHVIRMAARGGCFIGASLSCADLFVHLYSRVLRISPQRLADPDRDYLLLSKGHDVPALYATLAELGYFPKERLQNHLRADDNLYWHPSREVPGVEFHSGSLGHLLAVGLGIAMDVRLCGGASRIFVVLGDGELDEGSIWEACLVASAQKLDRLVVVVDRNGFQANLPTEELVPLEPLAAKFEAFGFTTMTVDGHDFDDLDRAFAVLPLREERPTAILAKTVRGRGVRSLESRADRWFVKATEAEAAALLRELHGGEAARLGEGLVVR